MLSEAVVLPLSLGYFKVLFRCGDPGNKVHLAKICTPRNVFSLHLRQNQDSSVG